MKKSRLILASLLLPAVLVAGSGCGPGSNTTPDEEAAYKMRDKSKVKPPPAGAMKPPENFKSSLSGEGAGSKPPSEATPATGGQ